MLKMIHVCTVKPGSQYDTGAASTTRKSIFFSLGQNYILTLNFLTI